MKCFLVVLVMTLARIALNEAAKWKCKYLLNKEKCTRSAKTASNLICFARFNVTMYLSIKAYKTKHKKNIKINFRLQGRNENKYVLIYLFLSQSFTTIINGKKLSKIKRIFYSKNVVVHVTHAHIRASWFIVCFSYNINYYCDTASFYIFLFCVSHSFVLIWSKAHLYLVALLSVFETEFFLMMESGRKYICVRAFGYIHFVQTTKYMG